MQNWWKFVGCFYLTWLSFSVTAVKTEGKQSGFYSSLIFFLCLIFNHFKIKNSNILLNTLNHLKKHAFPNCICFYLVVLVYLIKYMYAYANIQNWTENVVNCPWYIFLTSSAFNTHCVGLPVFTVFFHHVTNCCYAFKAQTCTVWVRELVCGHFLSFYQVLYVVCEALWCPGSEVGLGCL